MLPDNTTLCALIGVAKEEVDVRPTAAALDPEVLARATVVTFRDPPDGYDDTIVLEHREMLRRMLHELGATIVPWPDALAQVQRGKARRPQQLVSARVHAVIDVPRADPTLLLLENGLGTQVVTIARADELLRDSGASYHQKVRRGVRHLLEHRSEIVIGLFEDGRSGVVLNVNLDDTEIDFTNRAAWREWVRMVFIPKAVSPITPLPLERFELGCWRDTPAKDQVQTVIRTSRALCQTGLFPPGERFTDLAREAVERALLAQLTDGRSGYSLGFIAAGVARYRGEVEIGQQRWESLPPVPGLPPREARRDGDIWYVRAGQRFLEAPALEIASSISGADKNNLREEDIVVLTALNGRLGLQAAIPDFDWSTVRPSFDTYAMIGALFGAALATQRSGTGPPERVIVHFHGYPDPGWMDGNFEVAGTGSIAVPCGTPQAGLLNLRLGFELFSRREGICMGALVEPSHGTNLITDVDGLDDLLGALQRGRQGPRPPVELGGRNLVPLRGHDRGSSR